MSRLAAHYGEEIRHPVSGEQVRVFPRPGILAESDLRSLAITDQKRSTIREFSARVAEGTIRLEPAQDPEEFKRTVRTVKGIGAWSAEYMALRALGDTDAFPATDLIIRRFLKVNPQFDSGAVRPWRSYAAVGLWNEQARAPVKERKKGHAAV